MNDYLQIKELYHWGIKGQKWGVRRYQNADGTLTEEGKQRYGTSEGYESASQQAIAETAAVAQASSAAKSSADIFVERRGSKAIRKDYSTMSDQELQRRVNRLNLERSYGDLSGDTKYVQTGKEKTREILQTIGAVLGIAVTALTIRNLLRGYNNAKVGAGKTTNKAAKSTAAKAVKSTAAKAGKTAVKSSRSAAEASKVIHIIADVTHH